MKYLKFSHFGLLCLLFLYSNCNKSSVVVGENITTVKLNFLNKGVVTTLTYKDIDGSGGNSPIVDTIRVNLDQLLECSVDVLDESQQPAITHTSEILAESNEHLFLYNINKVDMQIAYNDTDDFGKNFGQKTLWKIGGDGISSKIGSVTITLKHEPTNKNDLANPGGENDFEVTFPVKYN
jgi:hypothetical protein